MSNLATSRAIDPPRALLPIPRPAPLYLGLAACLLVGFGLTLLIIVSYSNDSILGAMFRAAVSMENEDSWWPMEKALAYIKGGMTSGLYDHIFFTDKIKFQYSVTSLLFLDGFSQLITPSYRNLNLFNFALMPLLALSLAWLTREIGLWRDRLTAAFWLGACAYVTFTNFSILAALALGQIQLFIDFVFVLACTLWARGSRMGAGIAIGIITLIKPQMAGLLLWALLRRHWSFLRGFLAVTVPLTLLSIWLYGFWNHIAYLKVLSFVSQHGEVYFSNQSLNGLLNRFFGNGISMLFSDEEFARYDPRVHVASLVFSAVVIGLALLLGARARTATPAAPGIGSTLDFAVCAFAFTLASPIVWEHHYGIVPPLFLIAFAAIRDRFEAGHAILGYAALFATGWILLSPNLTPFTNSYRATPVGTLLQSYMFFGALCLFTLLVLLRSRSANTAQR